SDSTKNHKIIAGSKEYEVEAWGSCTVEVRTPNGKGHILLNRAAYIPDFMNSLVSLPKLVNKGVHWSSRFPDRLKKSDGSLFCHLFKSGDHIVFEPQENKVNFKEGKNRFKNCAVNSKIKDNYKPSYYRHKTFSKDQLHRILGHPSPEVIDHVENSVRDGNISIVGENEILRALEWESVDQSMSLEKSVFIDEDIIEDTIPVPIGYRKNITNKDNNIHKASDEQELGVYKVSGHQNKKEILYTKDGNRDLPKAKGNSAKRAALINPDIDEGNILAQEEREIKLKKELWLISITSLSVPHFRKRREIQNGQEKLFHHRQKNGTK
ncbi:hypothetical protein OnM2_052044, partial [Erysiphe neolycopersici]